MLKYNVRLTNDNVKQEEIVWREKYLSPDLSFVSGVTSQDYHLEKFNKIAASNTISHTPNSVLSIDAINVIRQGFIIIKDKEYKVESGTSYNGENNYECVKINGKYFYNQNGNILIDNWLQCTDGKNVEEKPYLATFTDDVLKIDTIVWIEDGAVVIDGKTYIYDFNVNGLMTTEKDTILNPYDITVCESIEFHPYSKFSDYKHVTKFILTKDENVSEMFENVSFIKYYYYIIYKDNYINIFKNEDDIFVCQVPEELLDENNNGLKIFSAYTDVYEDDNFDTEIPIIVSGDTFNVLRDNLCYIVIDNNKYEIQNEILNANNGSQIAVYLDSEAYNIGVGDIIYFLDNRDYAFSYSAYTDDGKCFVVFKGERYDVVPNLCDKVIIQDHEYEIEYVNGRAIENDCIVHIGDGDLSMVVSGDTEPSYLVQKGFIVSKNPSSAITMTYPIKFYSGITINGVNYAIYDVNGESSVNIDIPNEYKFVVSDVKGSSMLVCEPYLKNDYFSNEFIEYISNNLCEEVVNNQSSMTLYFKNKIFGDREITKELAYNAYSGSTSSDDYFNLFDNLSLYTANGYINVPLLLSTPQGNNLLQDDVVNRDFYKHEKEKAINPIIDMEKDVYLPKYFDGEYSGSQTIFKEINEIRFNLHFRTRNLTSWKINEEYNNSSTSALCNWFITDFYPYNEIINNRNTAQIESLFSSSDILGLLNFTNDDVYFQKSKIGKSFLRLSFYDSTNQQEQTLLGTSTIFMNENRLYKNYIDNSRYGLYKNQFLSFEEIYNEKQNLSSKINVKTEFVNGNASNLQNLVFDDKHRLGSEFIVTNKYETDTSSEGYYLYLFREYSEKLTPKPIYMKVEFNHAGIGRTIPFIIPMKWGLWVHNKYSATTEVDVDGNKVPVSGLTLDDLDELKRGIKLEDSYAQTYIPLYAVYDFNHKEYSYVFDRRYANVDEKGNLTFNLFEIKFANDTIVSDGEQEKITKGIQPTAKIDINRLMFGNTEKTCNA